MKATKNTTSGTISKRAEKLRAPHIDYLTNHIRCIYDPYSADTNPKGGIPLAVAENKLCTEMLVDQFNSFKVPFTHDMMHYTDGTGSHELKTCLASFLSTYVFQGCDILPEQLIISSGCTALLYQLSILLFERGDSVLVPTPFYPAFVKDFLNIGGVSIAPVLTEFPWNNITVENLQEAYDSAVLQGTPPKALLVTNPNNPLGCIYSSENLLAIIGWARCVGVHVIMDEVYALSTMTSPGTSVSPATATASCAPAHALPPVDKSIIPTSRAKQGVDTSFISMSTLLDGDLRDDIHMLWGLSKDFGASGLRCGCCYSRNTALLEGFRGLNDAFQLSLMTQHNINSLLRDHVFVDKYLQTNREELVLSLKVVTDGLVACGCSWLPVQSCTFVLADLRPLFKSDVTASGGEGVELFQQERDLFVQLATLNVALTPGESLGCPIPGYFRICYSWVGRDVLLVAMNRLLELREQTIHS